MSRADKIRHVIYFNTGVASAASHDHTLAPYFKPLTQSHGSKASVGLQLFTLCCGSRTSWLIICVLYNYHFIRYESE